MKFGIFYELQLPRPWGPDSEWQLFELAGADLLSNGRVELGMGESAS